MLIEKKKIVFLTGTRADYGKINSIMRAVDNSDCFELFVFVTGMHMHNEYGTTYTEVLKDNYKNVYLFINQRTGMGSAMDVILSNTISGFSAYIAEVKPDLIIVHGDRIEALAAAIVGAMNNILVGHIEGGEVSGTIDESIRHAITKLSHIHFVANEGAKKRVLQLGEQVNRIFIIGSPDIDIMLSPDLPSWEDTKARYEVGFDSFGIALFHPVTTSYSIMPEYAKAFTDALITSEKNYIVIHPNNDMGREFIVREYERFANNKRFRTLLSVRFEHFLTMLKQADFIIGNSSAGVREACVYGTPAIDIGDRQKHRYMPCEQISQCDCDTFSIMNAISCCSKAKYASSLTFGTGRSTERFMEIVNGDTLWTMHLQKLFADND